MGIEPTFEAWEAPVLPLNYTRMRQQSVSLQPTVVRSHHLTVEEWQNQTHWQVKSWMYG